MLADILINLNGIVDFIKMEWGHVLEYVNNVVNAGQRLEDVTAYLPPFLLPVVGSAVSILIVRRIINR